MADPRYPQLYERDEDRKRKSGVAGRVVAGLAGAIIPVRYSGKLYLIRELQKSGVDTSIIPEACLQELTTNQSVTAKVRAIFRV